METLYEFFFSEEGRSVVLAEGRETHQSSALNTLSHKGLVGQVETLHGPYEAGAQGRVLNWNTALGGHMVVAIR